MDRVARRAPDTLLALVLALVAVLAGLGRELSNARVTEVPRDPSRGWFSADPDTQYHARRLARSLDEGLPIAETDPWLDFPNGSAIPWPPYYAYVVHALVAPFAPEGEQRDAFLERAVASLPWAFATLAALVIAAAAWRASRGLERKIRGIAALVAGGTYALLGASFDVSAPGIGDHHAWVALLLAAMLAVASAALEKESLDRGARSLVLGAVLGALAGVLIGSWAGGLVYAVVIQLALGVAAFANARAPRPGFGALGLAFHAAWAAAVAPAVLSSPWKSVEPWMAINLSWFHLTHPLLGAALLAPLALSRGSERVARAWPWLAGAAALGFTALVAWSDLAFARGVREGFAWAGRHNTFMAFIHESQPLLWGQEGGFGVTLRHLGLGALLAAPAWTWVAMRAWRERRLELVPLVVALPPLALQALVQRRFADAFGVALAIALGIAAAWTLDRRVQKWRPAAAAALASVLVLVLQAPSVAAIGSRLSSGQRWLDVPAVSNLRAYRAIQRWIRAADPKASGSVLASWDQGHSIEWAAAHPSIATNFGSYLGEASYLDPWRFFLEDDPARADELLEARRVRYVLVTGEFTKDLEVMLRLLRPEERRSYLLIPREGPVYASQRFFTTMAARLMMQGRVGDLEKRDLVGDSLPRLRLVHVSPRPLATVPPIRHTNGPVPAGWVWEHVRGAVVETRGAPGERFELRVDVEYPGNWPRIAWVGTATCGGDGIASVTIPYATEAPNGDGRALGRARWSLGGRSGEVGVPARAVELGERIELSADR